MISEEPFPWVLLEAVSGTVSKASVTRRMEKEPMEVLVPSEPEPQLSEVTSVFGVVSSLPLTVLLRASEREKMRGMPSLLVFSLVVRWPSEEVGSTPETLPFHVLVSWVLLKVSE